MIEPQTFRDIVARIRGHMDPEKVILFGSSAREQATTDSDVDLLIVAETDLPVRERFPAARRLLADFPASFDLIVKTREEYERQRPMVNTLVYYADKYEKILYERSVAGGSERVADQGDG